MVVVVPFQVPCPLINHSIKNLEPTRKMKIPFRFHACFPMVQNNIFLLFFCYANGGETFF